MQVSPKLVVTSASTFWKSEEALESEVALAEFAELNEKFGDRVEVGATTFSETTGQKIKRKTGAWLKKLPYLALGAGALGVTIATAGLLTPLAALGVAGAATGGLSVAWLGTGLKDALENNKDAKGLAAFHTGFEKLDFENLPEGSPSQDALREMTIKNMELYPESRHVVHLNGHGHGAKSVAGMPAAEAHDQMLQAVKQTGDKYDVVFYETCYGANWEHLHRQAEVADFAVAFEDAIPRSNTPIGRLDLSDVLSAAVDAPTSREAAIKMALEAGSHFEGKSSPISSVPFDQRHSPKNRAALVANTDSTAVAVDLPVLRETLSPSLDQLGKLFTKSLADDEFRMGVRNSYEKNLLEKGGDLVDMGGFLSSLKDHVTEPESLKALEHTLKSLDAALVYKRTGRELPLSGLSFHSKPNSTSFSSPTSRAHTDPSLPQGWTKFVEQAF